MNVLLVRLCRPQVHWGPEREMEDFLSPELKQKSQWVN